MKNNYYDSSIEYPDDCIVDFDMRLIDLFKKLDQKKLTAKERITHEFYRVKEKLDGKIPTRMQLFTYMDDDVYRYCITHAKKIHSGIIWNFWRSCTSSLRQRKHFAQVWARTF